MVRRKRVLHLRPAVGLWARRFLLRQPNVMHACGMVTGAGTPTPRPPALHSVACTHPANHTFKSLHDDVKVYKKRIAHTPFLHRFLRAH